MAEIGELLIRLGLDEKGVKAGVAAAKGDLRGFSASVKSETGSAAKDAESASGRMGGALAKVGPAAGLGGAALLAVVGGIGIEAAKSATEFQTSMTDIAVAANLPETAVAGIGDAITNTSQGTTSSANDMAAALAPVAGELQTVAGHALDAATASQVLTDAQDLTEASGTALGDSLHSLTDLMLTFHQPTTQAAADANLLQDAHAQLGLGVGDLTAGLQKLQPRIAGSGLSLQQTVGIMKELTPVVGTGSRALSSVGTVLQSLVSPSSTATKALSDLGVTLTDSHGKFIGIPAAIDRIKAAYDKLPTTVGKNSKELSKATLAYDLFGKQANIAGPLLAAGSKGIDAATTGLTKSGTAAAAAQRKQHDLDEQQKTLGATMSTISTVLGQALIPAISTLASAILPIITAIAGWISGHKQLAGLILGALGLLGALGVALAVIGPIVGVIVGAFALLNPVTLLIGAIIVIVVLLATHWQQLGQIVGAIIGAIVGFVGGLVSTIAGAVANIVGFFLSIPSRVLAWEAQLGAQFLGFAAKAISTIASMVAKVVGAVLAIPGRAIGWVASLIAGVVSAGAQFLARIVTMAGQVVTTILGIPGRLLGGLVSGFAGLAGAVVHAFIGGLASLPGDVGGMLAKIPGVGLLGSLGGSIGHIFSHQEGAWNIPGTQLALLHQGEMVVPAGPAAALRASVTGSGTGMGAGAGQPLVGTIVVNNPTPEPASSSISRELQKLSAFGYANPAMAGVR